MSRKSGWMRPALVTMPFPFCLCTTEKAFWLAMNRLKVPVHTRPEFLGKGANATAHFFAEDDGRLSCIVCTFVRNDLPNSTVFALLAHEATHIWQEARRVIGEKVPSAEFEAYAIQSITQALSESYQRQREGYELQH